MDIAKAYEIVSTELIAAFTAGASVYYVPAKYEYAFLRIFRSNHIRSYNFTGIVVNRADDPTLLGVWNGMEIRKVNAFSTDAFQAMLDLTVEANTPDEFLFGKLRGDRESKILQELNRLLPEMPDNYLKCHFKDQLQKGNYRAVAKINDEWKRRHDDEPLEIPHVE